MTEDDIAAVEAVEDRRSRAIVAQDLVALDAITAEDYVHVETSGAVRTKAEFLEAVRTGTRRFSRYETSDLQVRIYGEVAVVHGVLENSLVGADGGLTPKRARFLRVYVRASAEWKNVSHLATEIPAA